MKFVLLSDYYEPIIKSGSIIIGDLAKELINNGHQVNIITFVDKQNKRFEVSKNNNIQIYRIKSPTRSFGKIGRLWAEIRYSSKIINCIKSERLNKIDGIICYSPSIFYGAAIKWMKKTYKVDSYLIIRDIFPKWALDSGLLKKGLLYKYFKRIERNLYSNSNFIGIEAKSDLSYFHNYGLNKSISIEVLNNWGSQISEIDDKFGKTLLKKNRVNIVYGGNMGDAQDLLSLIKKIDFKGLKNKSDLYLIGSGNQFDKIKKIIKKRSLTNVFILPAIDRELYLSVMKNADIGLVSLGSKMLSNNYPLKMIGYMQMGIPILASVNKNNEMINTMSQNNIGLVSLASDLEMFNKNLKDMISRKEMRLKQGKNALSLFDKKFTVSVAYSQIFRHFE